MDSQKLAEQRRRINDDPRPRGGLMIVRIRTRLLPMPRSASSALAPPLGRAGE